MLPQHSCGARRLVGTVSSSEGLRMIPFWIYCQEGVIQHFYHRDLGIALPEKERAEKLSQNFKMR